MNLLTLFLRRWSLFNEEIKQKLLQSLFSYSGSCAEFIFQGDKERMFLNQLIKLMAVYFRIFYDDLTLKKVNLLEIKQLGIF